MGMKRNEFRQMVKKTLLRFLDGTDMGVGGSAVVFAPHQDDETLGCGGTIIRKCRAGLAVWVVFLTDGGRSHSRHIEANAMKAIRAQEARNACQLMGVAEERILFLDFPNGALHQHRSEACEQVQEVLRKTNPNEVYIPSALDFHAEHRVTAQVVTKAVEGLTALQGLVPLPQVYEYPVWFWYQWPWVGLPDSHSTQLRRERKLFVRRGLRYGLGLSFISRFRKSVAIRDVLDVKRAALREYVSQMTAPEGAEGWKTLEEVGGGEFLECFFRDVEVFHPVKRSSE